jgi:hypothetical protein
MLQSRIVSTLVSSSLRARNACRPARRSFATSNTEVDGNVLTLKTDHEFWKLTTKNNEEKIRDYSVDYPTGRALSEEYFGFPETSMGKPLVSTSDFDHSWLGKWVQTGNVGQALKALEQEKPRLHNYEILAYGLIGHEATSEEVTAVLNHAKSHVSLTTTFLGQIMEAYVAAKDFDAALGVFENVQKAYNLPATLELQHKFLGLFQMNPKYAGKVEQVQQQFLEALAKGRPKGYGEVNQSELPEADALAVDPLLSVPAEKEQKILRSFLSGVSVNTPFEQGMKEWRRRLDSYITWHQAEEKVAVENLRRNHASLLEKYEHRNKQVLQFLEKRYATVQ